MAVLAVLLALVIVAAFRYFNEEAERSHERELRQMEQTDRILDETSTDPIDRELGKD